MKAKPTIVKVMRALSPDDTPLPATIYPKTGAHKEHQFLSPEQRQALGDDLFGYFTAERIDGRWWLGERLPNNNRGW